MANTKLTASNPEDKAAKAKKATPASLKKPTRSETPVEEAPPAAPKAPDRKSTRLNSSH